MCRVGAAHPFPMVPPQLFQLPALGAGRRKRPALAKAPLGSRNGGGHVQLRPPSRARRAPGEDGAAGPRPAAGSGAPAHAG